MFSRLRHVIVLVIVTSAILPNRCQDSDKLFLNSIYKNLMNSIDLEYLLQEYDKVCLREMTCTSNATTHESTNYYVKCPLCSCKDDCFLNNECCPDVIYGYLKFECVNVIQLLEEHEILIPLAYFMISTCPEFSASAFSSTLNNSFDVPVTSLTSGLTYKTRDFADCNEDNQSLVNWNATVSCPDDPFNYVEINTYEDLLENINYHNCIIYYSITNTEIPVPLSCKGKEYFEKKVFIQERRKIQNCNETGLWKHFDADIDLACRQLHLEYLDYKNVFCYICNPGLSFEYHETKPIISTCNVFDKTNSLNPEIEKACLTGDKTPYHLPFKNLYCKLCNIQRDVTGLNLITDELYTTFINVRGIQAKTVAATVGSYFDIRTNNNAYRETILNLDISYNTTYHKCSVPAHLPNSSFCNDQDFSCTEEQVCEQHWLYNCTNKFRNYVVKRDTHLDSYYESTYSEELLYSYVFEMYLCDEQVKKNILCDAFKEKNACLQSESLGNEEQNPAKRALSCLFCKKTTFDYLNNFVRNTEFEILMKITCWNLLEHWLYIDILSLLEVARTCSVTFTPSGIYDIEYDKAVTEQDSCLDFPFIDSATCKNVQGSFYFGSYRKLFSLPGESWNSLLHVKRRLPTSINVCAEKVDSTESQTNDTCREIRCSDGHDLVNGTCVSEYETFTNALYKITYRFAVSSSDCEGKLTPNTSDVCQHIWKMVENKVGDKTLISFHKCSVFANTECSEEVIIENAVSSDWEISLKVMVEFTTELTKVEREFVDSLTKKVEYQIRNDSKCMIKLKPSKNKIIQADMQLCQSFVYDRNESFVFKMTSVSKLLTCPQIELMEEEYVIDNISGALILTGGRGIVEYYSIKDGRFSICLDDWNIHNQSTYEVTIQQRMYKLVDNICTILSLLCLSITFITYTVLRPLQNVPGVNNMSLTFSLFFAQLTLKFGIWQPTDSILCPIFGVFIHFFWMATFCSMNICCFHMHRAFKDFVMSKSMFTIKTKVKYLLYTYLLPGAVIILTACTHLAFSNGYSFGYGKTICFLTDTVSVIVAFLVPCVLVFLSNVLFFGKTILFIRRTRSNSYIRRSDDRRDFFIYLRLWTLLGVTWPLLIADAMLDITVFSFIALGFNTLQGVFIFVSFVCNKRVLGMYRQMLSVRNKNTNIANSKDFVKT